MTTPFWDESGSMNRDPVRPPAKSPCGSCPYRQDVPSGVWAASEYEKLPAYDAPETFMQPPGLFIREQLVQFLGE